MTINEFDLEAWVRKSFLRNMPENRALMHRGEIAKRDIKIEVYLRQGKGK